MKKLLCAFLTLTMFYATPVMANDNITVKINNETINFDVAPQIINGITYVPMRTIFEKLGANVMYDNSTQTITATKDDTSFSMVIGERYATINGNLDTIEAPAKVINNRALVPIRVIAESFSCKIDWNESAKEISINTANNNSNTTTNKDYHDNYTKEQKAELWAASTQLVVYYLKCPSTAKFGKYNDNFLVY